MPTHNKTITHMEDLIWTLEHMSDLGELSFPHGRDMIRQLALFPSPIGTSFYPDTFHPSPRRYYLRTTTHFPLTREQWENLEWNPPIFKDPDETLKTTNPKLFMPDTEASPKPTWAELETFYKTHIFAVLYRSRRAESLQYVRRFARYLIREKYLFHAHPPEEAVSNFHYYSTDQLKEEEIFIRLQKGTNPQWTAFIESCDVWREHYKQRARQWERFINITAHYEHLDSRLITPVISNRKNWDATTWRLPFGDGELYSGGTPAEEVPKPHPAPSDIQPEPPTGSAGEEATGEPETTGGEAE